MNNSVTSIGAKTGAITSARTYTFRSRIAGMVGYRDIRSFSQVFRRIAGVTPGHYRKTFYHAE